MGGGTETAWLITSLSAQQASPEVLLGYNRQHWRIENNLHRNKDVALGEDRYTNRKDNAPRNIFSLNNLVLCLFKKSGLTPKKAIEVFPGRQKSRDPPRNWILTLNSPVRRPGWWLQIHYACTV